MQTIKGLGKHDHTLTDIIKVFIFFIVLTAPFLAILSKCLYVICNKNAQQSYYGETINEEQRNDLDSNELKADKTYYLITKAINTENTYTLVDIRATNIINKTTNTELSADYNLIRIFKSGTTQIYTQISGNNVNSITITTPQEIEFTFKGFINEGTINEYIDYWEILYNKYSYLDNVFYYATYQLNNEPQFSWVKQTAIYTGVNNMCTGLELQNGVLPLLITYWTLITAIYIIFDLIIKTFTTLTHLLK